MCISTMYKMNPHPLSPPSSLVRGPNAKPLYEVGKCRLLICCLLNCQADAEVTRSRFSNFTVLLFKFINTPLLRLPQPRVVPHPKAHKAILWRQPNDVHHGQFPDRGHLLGWDGFRPRSGAGPGQNGAGGQMCSAVRGSGGSSLSPSSHVALAAPPA